MLERLYFLTMYVGSAAAAAFVAACVSSPQVAMFSCDGGGANGAERCELAATLAVVDPEISGLGAEYAGLDISAATAKPARREPAAMVSHADAQASSCRP